MMCQTSIVDDVYNNRNFPIGFFFFGTLQLPLDVISTPRNLSKDISLEVLPTTNITKLYCDMRYRIKLPC